MRLGPKRIDGRGNSTLILIVAVLLVMVLPAGAQEGRAWSLFVPSLSSSRPLPITTHATTTTPNFSSRRLSPGYPEKSVNAALNQHFTAGEASETIDDRMSPQARLVGLVPRKRRRALHRSRCLDHQAIKQIRRQLSSRRARFIHTRNICGVPLADREPRCVHQLDLIDLTGVSVRARQNTNRLCEGANLARPRFRNSSRTLREY